MTQILLSKMAYLLILGAFNVITTQYLRWEKANIQQTLSWEIKMTLQEKKKQGGKQTVAKKKWKNRAQMLQTTRKIRLRDKNKSYKIKSKKNF